MRCRSCTVNSSAPAIFYRRLTSEDKMVRKRRRVSRAAGVGAAVAGLVVALGARVWTRMARRPVDTVAILGAAAASLIIIINAVFLQSGSQRGPFVANVPAPPQVAEIRSQIAPPALAAGDALRAPVSQQAPLPVAARHNDPIGDLIGASVGSLRKGRGGE
jgi:hypothetical protein